MKMMKSLLIAAVAAMFTTVAMAQEVPSNEPYEFLISKLAASEGRFDEALARIDKVIEKNPTNSVLLYERAVVLIDAGRLDQAEKELRKVAITSPDLYDAQRVLGRMLLERSGNDRAKVDEALEHLRAAWKLNPDDLSSGLAVANVLMQTGRAAEAERVIAQMLERNPDQRTLNYSYAQVLTKLGRGDESRQYLEKAVQLDPTFGPAILQLVDIYQKANEFAKAADVLQPLIADDPMNLDLQRQQALFYLRAGMSEKARAAFKLLSEADPKDARARLYYAEALNDLERYDEAEKIYRSLLEQTPEDVDVLSSYGISQVAQKKYDDAVKTFRLLLTLKDVPENLQVLANTNLALIELQRGNYESALAMTKPILIFHDKPNTQAVNIALDALRKQKKYNEALGLLLPLVEKFGDDPFVNARYVEMLLRAGEKDKAREMATTQLKFGARNAVATAEAYIQAGDYQNAIALVKQSLQSKPEDLDLNFALGSAYERAGDTAEAEKTFLAILAKHPDNAQTLNYLGYMYAESGANLDRAAEMLKKAVNEEPRNGAFIDSLGWLYFRQGNLEMAEKYLTDATHLLPRDATVHEHLGDVFAKRGDFTRALTMYRVALTLEPEPKDEAKLRTKIAELEKQAHRR